jgi:ABC-type transporter Mla subunit MlaD
MASDLQENVDEVESNLNEILPAVEAGTMGIHNAHSMLGDLMTQFKQHSSELRAVLDSLQSEGRARLSDVRNSHSQSEEMARFVDKSFDSAANETHEICETLSQFSDLVRTSIDALTAEVAETSNAFRERAEDLVDFITDAQESMTAQANELAEAIEGWSGSFSESQSQIEEKAGAFQESLTTHVDSVRSELVADAQSEYEAFRSIVDSQLLQDMQQCFAAIGEDIDHLSEDAKGAIESLAEDLRVQLNESLLGLQTHAENQIESEIKAGFDNLVDTCLSAFMAELVESVAMTQVGVSTTAVLAPVIPELIVAEKLLGAVKNLFD